MRFDGLGDAFLLLLSVVLLYELFGHEVFVYSERSKVRNFTLLQRRCLIQNYKRNKTKCFEFFELMFFSVITTISAVGHSVPF